MLYPRENLIKFWMNQKQNLINENEINEKKITKKSYEYFEQHTRINKWKKFFFNNFNTIMLWIIHMVTVLYVTSIH